MNCTLRVEFCEFFRPESYTINQLLERIMNMMRGPRPTKSIRALISANTLHKTTISINSHKLLINNHMVSNIDLPSHNHIGNKINSSVISINSKTNNNRIANQNFRKQPQGRLTCLVSGVSNYLKI